MQLSISRPLKSTYSIKYELYNVVFIRNYTKSGVLTVKKNEQLVKSFHPTYE